ncbi:MAG: hypothetical protein AMS27_05770 [Bacteroides sp. SM23_62_1]|nr:MAG: hypothetical protein AMS27_05770 [Bacteroides sp. SM23_62_1]
MKRRIIILLMAFTAVLILLTMCEKNPPNASFTHNSDSYEAGDTVNFVNKTSDADSYSWDFGDRSTSTQKDPWHIFDDPGNYSVTLTATNENGSDETSQNVTIKEPTILAFVVTQDTTENPVEGCAVILYDNQSDWENGVNEVAADFTDADGIVIFYHAKAIVYYIYALKQETGGAWFFAGWTNPIVLNDLNIYTVPAVWIPDKKASIGYPAEPALLRRIK